jgi:hypothetical protein
MILSKQSSFVLHISAIQPNITMSHIYPALGKGQQKHRICRFLSAVADRRAQTPARSGICTGKKAQSDSAEMFAFFQPSTIIFFHFPVPLSALKLRPVTRAIFLGFVRASVSPNQSRSPAARTR